MLLFFSFFFLFYFYLSIYCYGSRILPWNVCINICGDNYEKWSWFRGRRLGKQVEEWEVRMLHLCHWQCFWPGESCVDSFFFFYIAFIHLFQVNVSHFLRAYVERDGGVAGQITPLQGLPCCCWCSGESRCADGMKAASIMPLAWHRLVGDEVWIPPAQGEPEQEFFFCSEWEILCCFTGEL